MPETKICTQEQKVKVERRTDQVTQTYDIDYRNVEWVWACNRINKIVYKQNPSVFEQNIIANERLEITFGDQRHGEITRYGDKILIEPDSFYSWRLKQRLKNIHPKIMQEILSQLSQEAKSFLEKVLE